MSQRLFQTPDGPVLIDTQGISAVHGRRTRDEESVKAVIYVEGTRFALTDISFQEVANIRCEEAGERPIDVDVPFEHTAVDMRPAPTDPIAGANANPVRRVRGSRVTYEQTALGAALGVEEPRR